MTARFGNLAGRPPMGLKQPRDREPKRRKPIKAKPRKPRTGDDPAYLAAVRSLPCVICDGWGMRQVTPTEAHHAICGRGSQNKTPDRMAIPLCRHHHTGAEGIHTRRAWWVESFGDDRDFIAATQDAVDAQRGQTDDQPKNCVRHCLRASGD